MQVLEHMGFAPQRFSSRAKPFGRMAMRLREVFSIVAEEAESGDPKRRPWARNLLMELGGRHSNRLLLCGLLADLFHEHLRRVSSFVFSSQGHNQIMSCSQEESSF